MSSSARSARLGSGTRRFRLRASFFLSDEKETKESPGGGSRAFRNALPRRPRTPISFYGGHHQEGGKYPTGAGKNQDACLRANRCRSVPVERPPAPTRSIAPNFQPSRRAQMDGSGTGTCAGLAEPRRKTHPRSGTAPASALRRLLRRFAAGRFRVPPPPGGTSNRGDRNPP